MRLGNGAEDADAQSGEFTLFEMALFEEFRWWHQCDILEEAREPDAADQAAGDHWDQAIE